MEGLAPVAVADDLEVAAVPQHLHLQVVSARRAIVLHHLLREAPHVPAGHDVVGACVLHRLRGRQCLRGLGCGAVFERLHSVGTVAELVPGHRAEAAGDAERDLVPVPWHAAVHGLHGRPDPHLLLRQTLLPDAVERGHHLVLEVHLEVSNSPPIWVQLPHVGGTVDGELDGAPADGGVCDGGLLESCILAREPVAAGRVQEGVGGRVPGHAVGHEPLAGDVQIAKRCECFAFAVLTRCKGSRGSILVDEFLLKLAPAIDHPVETQGVRVRPADGRAAGGLGPVGMQDLPPVAVDQDLELLEAVHAEGHHVGVDLLPLRRALRLLHLAGALPAVPGSYDLVAAPGQRSVV
mmetsp:Transcript_41568/g.120345  ORF Transcript_41568/g.120345 Transcript_41568/m.120345 type:complete len:350 (-) Transcript_41568:738-1787(-)